MQHETDLRDWIASAVRSAAPFWFSFVGFFILRLPWARLAAAYPAEGQPPDGLKFRWRSGKIGGWMSYNNCLNITLAGEGIYVVPMLFFRLLHSPMLLPWSGVQSVDEVSSPFARAGAIRFADDAGRSAILYAPAGALPDIRAMSGRGDLSAARARLKL